MRKTFNTCLAVGAISAACLTGTLAVAQGVEFDADMVAAAQGEGPVLIYSAVPFANWEGVVTAMQERAPWFEVEVLELNSAEVFSRYEIEANSNAATADMLATSIRPSWGRVSEAGLIAPTEIDLPDGFPDWAAEFPGVYSFSINPHLLAYNKLLIDEADWPESIADVAALVESDPDTYTRAITAYTPDNAYGRQVIFAWQRDRGDAGWDNLETIIPAMVEEASGGTMLAKLTAGEYRIAFFQSGNAVRRSSNDSFDRVVGWTLPSDGVVVNPTSAAVTSQADSPNAAALFLQFITSEEGQAALPEGAGMNPILGLPGEGETHFTYQSVVDMVGAENAFLSGASPAEADAVDAFYERWVSNRGE